MTKIKLLLSLFMTGISIWCVVMLIDMAMTLLNYSNDFMMLISILPITGVFIIALLYTYVFTKYLTKQKTDL